MKLLAGILTLTLLIPMGLIENDDSLFDFKLKKIDGEEMPMSDYEGSVLLIVNTASECGFTSQYEGLQSIYDRFKDKNFYVLGFPANNFGGQEPGANEEIAEFCRLNFGVEFPLFSKISVKGDDIHPMFDYLTGLEQNGITGEVEWNFEKFLIDRNGELVQRYRSSVEPESEELIREIEQALGGS